MLLQNIALKCGLYTMAQSQLIVMRLINYIIEVRILTGSHARETTLIQRITPQPTIAELPFKFSKQEFFVKLAFAIEINKS